MAYQNARRPKGLSCKPNIYVSWSTSELRVRLAPLNRFKPSSKLFYWPFQGGTSFVDLLCFCSVLCLLCFVRVCLYVLCGHLLGKGLALVCGVFCEFVTFPLVSWVRCGTWLYRFLIFAPLLTCIVKRVTSVKKVMYAIFFIPNGLAIQVSIPKGKSMNTRFYRNKVLRKFVKFYQKFWPKIGICGICNMTSLKSLGRKCGVAFGKKRGSMF